MGEVSTADDNCAGTGSVSHSTSVPRDMTCGGRRGGWWKGERL